MGRLWLGRGWRFGLQVVRLGLRWHPRCVLFLPGLVFAGIRVLSSCFTRRPCAFAFSLASAFRCLLREIRRGVFAFVLASALCLRASSVAPVRGDV